MPNGDETYERATAEANEVFGRMGSIIDEQVKSGATWLDVSTIAREAGLEIDDRVLGELQIPPQIAIHPFIPWYIWFPWRPLWCWWWNFRYPWYRCCPYWWYRCHWHPW